MEYSVGRATLGEDEAVHRDFSFSSGWFKRGNGYGLDLRSLGGGVRVGIATPETSFRYQVSASRLFEYSVRCSEDRGRGSSKGACSGGGEFRGRTTRGGRVLRVVKKYLSRKYYRRIPRLITGKSQGGKKSLNYKPSYLLL